jgi:cyanate permease
MMMKGASPSSAGLIASTTIWVMIPTVLLVPRLSYKLGVRKPFLWLPSIALAFAAWGTTWASISMSWYLMALVGVLLATRYTTLLALPIYIMDEKEVGTASGIFLSVGYTGGVIGPLIGGSILDTTQSLDSSFIIIAVISIAIAFLAWRITETGLIGRT